MGTAGSPFHSLRVVLDGTVRKAANQVDAVAACVDGIWEPFPDPFYPFFKSPQFSRTGVEWFQKEVPGGPSYWKQAELICTDMAAYLHVNGS